MLQSRDSREVIASLSYRIASPTGEIQYLSKCGLEKLLADYGYVYRIKNGELLVFDSEGSLIDIKIEEDWNVRIDAAEVTLQ